jgi:hypothetical protein
MLWPERQALGLHAVSINVAVRLLSLRTWSLGLASKTSTSGREVIDIALLVVSRIQSWDRM